MTRNDEEGRKEVAEESRVKHCLTQHLLYIHQCLAEKQTTAGAKSPRPAEFINISFSHEKTSFHSSADLSRLDSHESRPAALCPEPTSDSPSACSENGNSRITWHSDSPIPSTLAQSTLNSAKSAVAKRKVWFRIMLPCRSHALQIFYASNLS